MSNFIAENENDSVKQINPLKNFDCKEYTKVLINVQQSEGNVDDQSMINENNNKLTNVETTHSDIENSLNSRLSWKDLYPQLVASCVSLLMVIQPGINLAYSNNMLHHIPSLNKGHFSWITSILALCTPIGAILIGLVMDRIGRKKACILTCLPLLASWLLASIITSDSIYIFYVSRMLAGIGAGMTTVGIVYVSEISHSSYKQLLLSLNSVFFSAGVLLSTSLVYLEWQVINFIFVGLTVMNLALIMVCMPESPIWLLKFKGPDYANAAKTAMKQIYPKNNRICAAEWERLKAMSNCGTNDAVKPSFVESVRTSPAAYKPMAILVFLLLLQQMTGAYPTISYALPILKSIVYEGDFISETKSLMVLGAIRFAASLLTCLLSFYIGRKPLLMFSCIGMTLSSALVMFTFNPTSQPLLTNYDTNLPRIPLSLFGVMLYVFTSSLGVLVFPWTLTCELLSTSVRAVGGSLLVSYSYLLMFVVLKAFPYVLAAFSLTSIFMIFGIISLLMATYVYLVVPETRGKSFQEIEDYFTHSNKN